ncbi:hypothetical protein D1872_310300 [compost metagenome]
MYLNAPTSRNGTSSACSIFRAITSTTVVANDEPIMRVAMISPAISSVFFAPMRLMIHGEQNMIIALQISPAVVANPKARVPSSGVAKNDLKKVANC